MTEPTTPPATSTTPIFTSTLLRRYWAMAPETEEARICIEPVPTATAEGTPMKISKGVSRKPPPTPNRPERNPTAQPMPRKSAALTDISAMGR